MSGVEAEFHEHVIIDEVFKRFDAETLFVFPLQSSANLIALKSPIKTHGS